MKLRDELELSKLTREEASKQSAKLRAELEELRALKLAGCLTVDLGAAAGIAICDLAPLQRNGARALRVNEIALRGEFVCSPEGTVYHWQEYARPLTNEVVEVPDSLRLRAVIFFVPVKP